MQAILYHQHGSLEQLYLGNAPSPSLAAHEVRVAVAATALNRADLLQLAGKYPPPPGASSILGLEMAGTVIELGKEVSHVNIGDRVCALLPGGGYAQEVSVPASLVMPIPSDMSFVQAAALPEVFLTAFQALDWLAQLQTNETVLIHAGGSGVGTAAIQLAKMMEAATIITTASAGKHDHCQQLGAHHCIDYQNEDFTKVVKGITEGKGVDVIIDFVGGPNFTPNINSMAMDARMVMLAFLGGIHTPATVSLGRIIAKRLRIIGSTLRARSLEYKTQLVTDFMTKYWPMFATSDLRPVIDSVYPWQDVQAAFQHMAANKNVGKIILEVSD